MGKDKPRTEVVSSNVAAVWTKGRHLVVEFKSGGTYQYEWAAPLWKQMVDDPSVGGFFHRNVKNKFAWRKVG